MDKRKLLYILTFCVSMVVIILWATFFVPAANTNKEVVVLRSFQETIERNLRQNHQKYFLFKQRLIQLIKGEKARRLRVNFKQRRGGLVITLKELRITKEYFLAIIEAENTSNFDILLPSVIYLVDKEGFLYFTPEVQPDDFLYLALQRFLEPKEKILGTVIFPSLTSNTSLGIFFEGVRSANCFPEKSNCYQTNFILRFKLE